MFRDGLLSPRSKLFASTRSSSALSDDLRPLSSASELSLASTATATTKSGVPKDARDTTRRRVRHRDGRLLRGGIGLTTGLGWSDSEDEDAPSPLTRQLSAAQLARRDSKDAAPARALSPLASERSSMSTPTARTLDRARVASVQNALAAAKSALHKAAAARPLYTAPAPPGEGLPTPAASPVLGPSRARADSTRSRQDSLLSGQDALVRRQDSLASVRSAASSASSLRSSASVGNLTPRRDLPVRPAGTGGIPRKASAASLRSGIARSMSSGTPSNARSSPALRQRTYSAAPAPTAARLSGPTTRALAILAAKAPTGQYTRMPAAPRPLHLALGPPAIALEPGSPGRAPRVGTGMVYRRTSGGYTGGQPASPARVGAF
jgi:hypothetical protein